MKRTIKTPIQKKKSKEEIHADYVSRALLGEALKACTDILKLAKKFNLTHEETNDIFIEVICNYVTVDGELDKTILRERFLELIGQLDEFVHDVYGLRLVEDDSNQTASRENPS